MDPLLDSSSGRQVLSHVVAVFNDAYVRFTPMKLLEDSILDNAFSLMGRDVHFFTIFDWRGIMRRHFCLKYAGCRMRQIRVSYDFERSSLTDMKNVDFTNGPETDSHGDLHNSFYLEYKGSDTVISQFNPSHHSHCNGIRLTFLDRAHSHYRIINVNLGPKLPYKCDGDVVNTDCYDTDSRYAVPSDEYILQIGLQKELHMLEENGIPLPDLLISVQPRLWHILRHIFSSFYIKWINPMLSALSYSGRHYLEQPTDFLLAIDSIIRRLSSSCYYGYSIVHQFGPCGVPPWFLAASELYECFGLSWQNLSKCIDTFFDCERRNGR
ncbi:hypothetical protein BBOV_II007730 [Babesia bovis T2Bo]|uniref:Uncharacterized protein n=1 Tax=Babesia bovis TaxID=5865 RepID=A7AUW2_BABBO|nr:hypothetical protein BBOV_II007730 [Babesia bovis T2Bo]EDO06723.1 hypothetical protein BBOV_II007730 [Babesia bovis T2Bo]|eukprot:XP_001610291.1 hypothetical protein [Babesia bovis T2Bo]